MGGNRAREGLAGCSYLLFVYVVLEYPRRIRSLGTEAQRISFVIALFCPPPKLEANSQPNYKIVNESQIPMTYAINQTGHNSIFFFVFLFLFPFLCVVWLR